MIRALTCLVLAVGCSGGSTSTPDGDHNPSGDLHSADGMAGDAGDGTSGDNVSSGDGISGDNASSGDGVASDGAAGDTSGDAVPGDESCPPLWTVTGVGQASVSAGVLHLNAPLTSGPTHREPLRLTQDGLTGDFTLSVTYSNFVIGSGSSRLQMQVYVTGSPPTDPPAAPAVSDRFVSARRGQGTMSVVAHNGVDAPLDQSMAVTSFAGSFHIIRSGSVVTVSSSGTGAVELATGQIDFDDEPLTVALELQQPVTSGVLCPCTDANVVLDDFFVAGSGVSSDDFSCDRLVR